ncbi:hypothetical protein CF327_g6546 [Tilletia walkeri]|uniref:SGF29 C-terminal domain-containing protein n=1 Tax=Tilletia walkeri TaxID=117179 RepID=A0A8X7N6E8_9BASI|nr:hypothetical protein CF327_g6546 [Tilletia walkeri]KAE8266615.1 hypothetical protein A4X09_0g5732 [Tilletia walkeri]
MPPRKDRQSNAPSSSANQHAFHSGAQADESVEQQLWHKVRAQLRILEQLRPTTERTLRELDRLQSQLGSPPAQASKDAAKAKGLSPDLVGAEDRFKENERILKLCEEATATGEAEEGAIDTAIEQLSILIALTSAPPDHGDSKRKKRRTEASPPRGSLSPTMRTTPLPGSGANTPSHYHSLSQHSHLSEFTSSHSSTGLGKTSGLGTLAGHGLDSHASSSHGGKPVAGTGETKKKSYAKGRRATASSAGTYDGGRGSSPISTFGGAANIAAAGGSGSIGLGSGSASVASSAASNNPAEREYVDPARARREVLAHQLPLRKGRRVAFRQPTKRNPGPGGQQPVVTESEDGETWIMATVEECINNDRNRYVVRDLEDEGQTAAATWNTTLKAIVPLPENVHTLPPHDYTPGSQVMALYPDTTCFYRATVVSGGPGLHKLTAAKAAKKEQELLNQPYKLIFEDDGDDVKSVPAFLVVERP